LEAERRQVVGGCSYHLLAHRTTYAYAVAGAHLSAGVLDQTPNSPPWVPFHILHVKTRDYPAAHPPADRQYTPPRIQQSRHPRKEMLMGET
jgi:hypothetical protein